MLILRYFIKVHLGQCQCLTIRVYTVVTGGQHAEVKPHLVLRSHRLGTEVRPKLHVWMFSKVGLKMSREKVGLRSSPALIHLSSSLTARKITLMCLSLYLSLEKKHSKKYEYFF